MDARTKKGQAFYFNGENGDGCLLLHGFAASPGHMRFLGEELNKNGYTVMAPLLPGHGTTLNEMDKTNFHQWLTEAQLAYTYLRKRCDRVYLIGHSMGGVLALILAEQYPVDALICLAPAIKIRSKLALASRPISALLPFIPRRDSGNRHGEDFLYEYHYAYGGMPTRKIYDLRRLILLASSNMFAVVAPTLIFQPIHDKTLNPKGAKILYDNIGSNEKELIWLEKSDHILTLGPERKLIITKILDWIVHKPDVNSLAK